MLRRRVAVTCLLSAPATLLLMACGGEKATGPATEESRLTAPEAQVVAAALFEEVANAFAEALGSASVSYAGDVGRSTPVMRSTPTARAAASARLATLSVASLPTLDFDEQCQLGGRIAGSVSITDNTNDSGTGTVTGRMTVTPRGCVVSAGARTLAVSGNPSLIYEFGVAFRDGELSSDFVWRASGGISWPGGSCSADYTVVITPNGTGSIRGTLCGQDVSDSF
jgi:hypothetical protein